MFKNNLLTPKYKRKFSIIMFILSINIIFGVALNYRSAGVFFNGKRKVPIYCVDTKDKKVAISFDTSWGANNTVKILDVLDKYNVKTTFFLVGRWADEFVDETNEIHKRGHEIGNHSDKHPNMTRISKDKIQQEIAITDAKIMKITGKSTKLFRCPEGAYNNDVLDAVKAAGHYCIQWDVDSIDWKGEGAEKEYNRVIEKVKPGSIILFHNNGIYTPETLPKIIEKLKKEGYEFVTVGELIYKEDYYIDNSGKQIKN